MTLCGSRLWAMLVDRAATAELDPGSVPGARFVRRIDAVVPADGTGRLTAKSR
jgi:hypothetical protein